jgi:hypothetical protein
VDPRVGLDDVDKRKFLTLRGHEHRPLGRPVRSQSLYLLSYRGSYSNGLQGVTCQKIETFITTVVRTSVVKERFILMESHSVGPWSEYEQTYASV